MKISKLFHWLYAIVMLLPVFIFIPNAFYYGFNETAQAQTRTEQVPVYYSTNSVESYSDLVIGNAYSLHVDNVRYESFIIYISDYDFYNATITSTYHQSTTLDVPLLASTSSNGVLMLIDPNETDNAFIFTGDIAFIYRGHGTENQTIISNISPYGNYFKEYTNVEYSMSITDSMSTAWNQVWTNDIFSWSYNSFLSEPFMYIGNVFGLPVDNPMYYCLSYWLDISIIWLVFDLIMFIPLLVHRWIDKGIVE